MTSGILSRASVLNPFMFGLHCLLIAVSLYEQILKSGRASPAVYFNLGNAFFKAGQIGRAINAYHQARGMAPRDPDVLANLQFARNQVQGATFSPSTWQRWLGVLSLNEWTLLAAAAVWALLLLLVVPQLRPALSRSLRNWTITLGLAAVCLCGCLAADFYSIRVKSTAVVIARDAVLHQSPLAESPGSLTLHDGAEVVILDRKDNWLQVTPAPHQFGWAQIADVLPLRGEPWWRTSRPRTK